MISVGIFMWVFWWVRLDFFFFWLDFELGFLMVWFALMLILGQFCGGLYTVEMGCSGDGWVVPSWWLDICLLLLC